MLNLCYKLLKNQRAGSDGREAGSKGGERVVVGEGMEGGDNKGEGSLMEGEGQGVCAGDYCGYYFGDREWCQVQDRFDN